MTELPSLSFEELPEVPAGELLSKVEAEEVAVPAYDLLKDPSYREVLGQRTEELIDEIIEHKIDAVVFLDKSARPISWLFRVLWKNTRQGETAPKIYYYNPDNSKTKTRYRVEDLREAQPGLQLANKIIVVDEFILGGSTLSSATKEVWQASGKEVYSYALTRTSGSGLRIYPQYVEDWPNPYPANVATEELPTDKFEEYDEEYWPASFGFKRSVKSEEDADEISYFDAKSVPLTDEPPWYKSLGFRSIVTGVVDDIENPKAVLAKPASNERINKILSKAKNDSEIGEMIQAQETDLRLEIDELAKEYVSHRQDSNYWQRLAIDYSKKHPQVESRELHEDQEN